jgi:hypothetical protein
MTENTVTDTGETAVAWKDTNVLLAEAVRWHDEVYDVPARERIIHARLELNATKSIDERKCLRRLWQKLSGQIGKDHGRYVDFRGPLIVLSLLLILFVWGSIISLVTGERGLEFFLVVIVIILITMTGFLWRSQSRFRSLVSDLTAEHDKHFNARVRPSKEKMILLFLETTLRADPTIFSLNALKNKRRFTIDTLYEVMVGHGFTKADLPLKAACDDWLDATAAMYLAGDKVRDDLFDHLSRIRGEATAPLPIGDDDLEAERLPERLRRLLGDLNLAHELLRRASLANQLGLTKGLATMLASADWQFLKDNLVPTPTKTISHGVEYFC